MSPANYKIVVLTLVVLSCLIQVDVVDGGRVLSRSESHFQTSQQYSNIVNKIHQQVLAAANGASCNDTQESKVSVAKTKVLDVYRGASAKISIHQPRVSQDESSSARISIKTTGPGNVEHVEAGLTVNPSVNGDGMTRVYVKWTGKDSCSGCYNLDCAGFVLTNNDFGHINTPASPVSVEDGPQYSLFFKISMNETTGDWWLMIHNETTPLGYWPSKLFDKLGNIESSIEWGGEVRYPKGSASPQMGSGYSPGDGFGKAAYFRELQYIDENYGNFSVADNQGIVTLYSDESSGCYDIGNHVSQSDWGYNFFYGGPGFC